MTPASKELIANGAVPRVMLQEGEAAPSVDECQGVSRKRLQSYYFESWAMPCHGPGKLHVKSSARQI
jgi:hypothetical protein